MLLKLKVDSRMRLNLDKSYRRWEEMVERSKLSKDSFVMEQTCCALRDHLHLKLIHLLNRLESESAKENTCFRTAEELLISISELVEKGKQLRLAMESSDVSTQNTAFDQDFMSKFIQLNELCSSYMDDKCMFLLDLSFLLFYAEVFFIR